MAELSFALSPLGNGWTGPGQFEFRRFRATTGSKGLVSDHKLQVALPTARFPPIPVKPGRYVFVRFLTVTSMSSVWEDLWLEEFSDGSAPRILSLVWSPAG